ncbi:MAG: PA14 domain-containing protein [Blastocatellia bacterium]
MFVLFFAGQNASTQTPSPSPTPSCFPARPVALDHWRGEYFNSRDLAGAPAMVRDDGAGPFDFDWGLDGPSKDCGINVDDFSVRWTRQIPFGSGAYRFTITSDDGVRLLIDGQERFSNWTDHALTTNIIDVALTAGNHKITLEYYERLGSAVVGLKWKEHPCVANVPPDRWKGEYFNNASFNGNPAMVSDDGDQFIRLDWGQQRPDAACGVKSDAISIRWSRKAAFAGGLYRFRISHNGDTRIFIDGQLKLSYRRIQAVFPFPEDFDLPLDAGNHSIVVEYQSNDKFVDALFDWKFKPCVDTMPEDHWRGEYFNNDSLAGSPAMVRDDGDRAIAFNWGEASPAAACGVRADGFSARWRKSQFFAGGVYRFLLAGSGGVKFSVDGETKWEAWRPATFKQTVEVELAQGLHQLSLEYADLAGTAGVNLNWSDPPCIDLAVPFEQWRAEYFDNPNLSGRPVAVRNEGTRMIDFEQGLATPQPDCPDLSDNFSVRWSRTATFEATTYRFTVTADDGVRLLIDGKPVIDQWRDQAPASFAADVEMTGGKHRIVLEYYDRYGGATARLSWTPAPCNAAVPMDHWRGEYFNNTDLGGKAVMTRDDGNGAINFDWGLKSPEANCRINADNFSVRWTRTAVFSAGLYRFNFTGDDGVRIYVDRQLKLDRWQDQMAAHSFDLPMTAGSRQITVEYFDRWGSAAIKFDWERHPCFADVPPESWRGEYFNNMTLGGPPAMIRNDGEGGLNFDWGARNPATTCGIGADGFSVRWSRKAILAAGRHRFTVTADDGIRLFVNGRRLIDEWRNQPPATFTAEVMLPAGSHRIVVEYYDHTGGATAKVNWEMGGKSK